MAPDTRTLEQWQEWARRDDAFKHFVPSDLRVMLGTIDRLRAQVEDAEIALNTWDSAHDSEYWLRHPRDPGDGIPAGLER